MLSLKLNNIHVYEKYFGGKFMNKQQEEDFSAIVKDFKGFFNNTQGEKFDENSFLSFLKENPTSEPQKENVSRTMEPKFVKADHREEFNPNSIAPKKQGNVLILTELGVGDFIIATGTIREIRRIYPKSHITLVAHRKTLSFAEICPYVDEVILNTKFSDKLPEMYEFCMETARKLLNRRFDICFSLSTHIYTDLLMYMSGARIRLTSLYWRKWTELDAIKKTDLLRYIKLLATHIVPYGDTHCHMADRNFSLPEEILHMPILNRKLESWYTPEDLSAAKENLKDSPIPFYALSMGGTWARKRYPPEKYAHLLEMIAEEEPSAHFVILGGGNADLKSAEIIKATVPKLYEKRITDLTNKLTYRQSAAALSFCKMLIANDTGTAHIAAGLGCPVLSPHCFPADFKLSNLVAPARWAPYGVPCVIVLPEHALPECQGKLRDNYGCRMKEISHCITQIEPETLLKGFHLLKKRAKEKIIAPLYIY